jgi:hypothetical protein
MTSKSDRPPCAPQKKYYYGGNSVRALPGAGLFGCADIGSSIRRSAFHRASIVRKGGANSDARLVFSLDVVTGVFMLSHGVRPDDVSLVAPAAAYATTKWRCFLDKGRRCRYSSRVPTPAMLKHCCWWLFNPLAYLFFGSRKPTLLV